ncbi:acyltransferase [Sphingomonas hengshuiensis]|uniref:Acyltransferase n=2 Tax=Sphingomonas hengshuiensis TaxID=1609977 RepID=A0A7U5BF99_9SPHN|nr:acyltransferase [Sphingomonas hengshuiensis]
MMGELRALTAMRGIAAWLVVLFHLRHALIGVPAPLMAVFAHGYLAVDFFFLLSGLVIWLSYADRVRSGGWAAVPQFLRRRVARIWPLHLVMLGGAVALALAMRATGRAAPDFPFAELPLHLLLLQNWGFTDALAWNVPAWSISCELAAYLVFPLLAFAIDWRRVPSIALAAIGIALLLALHGLFASHGATQLGQAIPRLGVARCILEFGCGTIVGALWLRWRATWRTPAALAGLVAILLATSWIGGVLPETLAMPAAFAAALLALALTAGRTGNPLEGAALHYLGMISYATYLSHYLLWFTFKLALVEDPRAVGWPLIGLYLLLVLGASITLYHLVERPAQRWLSGSASNVRKKDFSRKDTKAQRERAS